MALPVITPCRQLVRDKPRNTALIWTLLKLQTASAGEVFQRPPILKPTRFALLTVTPCGVPTTLRAVPPQLAYQSVICSCVAFDPPRLALYLKWISLVEPLQFEQPNV